MSFYVGDPGGAYTAAAAGKCCNLNVHLKNYNFSLIKKNNFIFAIENFQKF